MLMIFIYRIIRFNFLHILALLLANLIWGLFRAFVMGELDQDIAQLDLLSQIVSLVILSVFVAWSLGLYAILLSVALIQLVSITSLFAFKNFIRSNRVALKLSITITIMMLLPYFALMCFEVFNMPLLFWFSYPLFVFLEWIKYRNFVDAAQNLDEIQKGQPA